MTITKQTVYLPVEKKGSTNFIILKNMGINGLGTIQARITEAYVLTAEEIKNLIEHYNAYVVGQDPNGWEDWIDKQLK